jgi:DNA-binding IclR family transcriptional regulator
MPSKSKALATVHNALALLDAFTHERPEWGLRELAREHALPQATMSRLVGALYNEGFLAQTPAKRYRLNMSLQEIGLTAARGAGLYALALPEVVRIRVSCGLATTLSVLEGCDAVFLERLGTCEGERFSSPRKRWPAYATSGGKAMLAFGPPALFEDAMRGPREACTPRTLTQRARLKSELQTVRSNGYATEIGESQIGWSGLGVPIFTATGTVAGALSVEVWEPTWNPAGSPKIVSLLREAAAIVGAALA